MGYLVGSAGFLITLAAVVAAKAAPPRDAQEPARPLAFEERVIAGGPADFTEVRHLILRGSDFEIGRKLAEIGRTRHRTGPIPLPLPHLIRAQRRYFERYHPAFVERMRGVAAAWDMTLEDEGFLFSGLWYGFRLPGCSSVFYPPDTTTIGKGVFSRNFDSSIGTLDGTAPAEGELPVCARPYLIELHPDRGYASLAMCCFDLLGGVCDGINSEGLVVAAHVDAELIASGESHPIMLPQAGFNEIQILRYLLDTCADVEEAKAALLEAKLYYNIVPNHYLIADRHGRSFVWENAPILNRGFLFDGGGRPQATTNFLQQRHRDLSALPPEEHPRGWFNRFRAIRSRLEGSEGKFDLDFIRETNRCVASEDAPPQPPEVPTRTLWHALYVPEDLRVEIDFYLGEEASAESPGGVRIRRSGPIAFSLKPRAE